DTVLGAAAVGLEHIAAQAAELGARAHLAGEAHAPSGARVVLGVDLGVARGPHRETLVRRVDARVLPGIAAAAGVGALGVGAAVRQADRHAVIHLLTTQLIAAVALEWVELLVE